MRDLAPGFEEQFVWPESDVMAVDASLCYHSRQHAAAVSHLDVESLLPVGKIVDILEMVYSETKVFCQEWPKDFEKFIRNSVDWNASPGWP